MDAAKKHCFTPEERGKIKSEFRCKWCGSTKFPIQGKFKPTNTCSRSCAGEIEKAKRRERAALSKSLRVRHCKQCGKEIAQGHFNRLFCAGGYCKRIYTEAGKSAKEYRQKKRDLSILKRRLYAENFKCSCCGGDIPYKGNKINISPKRMFCSRKCYVKAYKPTLESKLRKKIGIRVYYALKEQGKRKDFWARHFCGCDAKSYREWLERQFTQGMTWDNYGKDWHVHHIQPVSSFDLTNKWQLSLCEHFTNKKPLWAADNMSIGDKITVPQLSLPL